MVLFGLFCKQLANKNLTKVVTRTPEPATVRQWGQVVVELSSALLLLLREQAWCNLSCGASVQSPWEQFAWFSLTFRVSPGSVASAEAMAALILFIYNDCKL
ncbi:hypothetical protein A8L34_10445 [Bacillus sp. FJAT-27264]|nr:hypothetical protein A8L34_10445 [Bacillus sp. FJAT-27264]